MSELRFVIKKFAELSNLELYQLLRLRVEIFVVEQDCPYQDLDDKDQKAYHLMGFDHHDRLVAYTRLLAPGISYANYSSIGRVVVDQSSRKFGFGYLLMNQSITECKRLYTDHPIKISAQSYLLKFYTSLGFKAIGAEYLEDGIPHYAMVHAPI